MDEEQQIEIVVCSQPWWPSPGPTPEGNLGGMNSGSLTLQQTGRILANLERTGGMDALLATEVMGNEVADWVLMTDGDIRKISAWLAAGVTRVQVAYELWDLGMEPDTAALVWRNGHTLGESVQCGEISAKQAMDIVVLEPVI